jgi:hypothetical protein
VRRCGLYRRAKRPEHEGRQVIWSISARPSSYKKHGKKSLITRVKRKIEYAKSQLRAKVEHPFRVINRQFGLHQSALSWPGEEHRPAGNTVCVIEPVDGAKKVTDCRRGAPVMEGITPAKRPSRANPCI